MGLRKRLPAPEQLWALCKDLGRRSRPALLIAGSISMVLGTGYLGYRWMTHSPRFDIAELRVNGSQELDQPQISELLALGDKANIFRTDMDTLEARLSASPWIASASVSRSLPNALEIEVQEHLALAAVELDGLYLLNAEGEPFKRAQLASEELDGLCVITGLSRELFLAAPEHSQQQLQHALKALQSYHSNAKRPRLGELHLDERHGITLITYENAIAIHLGNPALEELDDRYHTFDSAWGALDSEEHAAARAFRIADRTPSDRVTIAFAGN